MRLSVRELTDNDIPLIINYWLSSPPAFLEGMGVDLSRMPSEQEWREMLTTQLQTPLLQKKSYCIIWEVDGVASGHCNINKIVPDKEAYMHLHLWHSEKRKKGMGAALIRQTLPLFFEAYNLEKLYSEPYALNPAPNKTLAKSGFQLTGSAVTIPGWLNFEQEVNLWMLSRQAYLNLYSG